MGASVAKISSLLAAVAAAALLAVPASAQSPKKQKKTKPPEALVENYFGGVFLKGDGGVPNGPCFRINGRVTSGDFFNDLKSYASSDGVTFRRGANEVAEFPDKLQLSLTIGDQPCSLGLQPVGTAVFLTQELMSSLKLSLYWKHGVDLRPAGKVTMQNFSVDPIQPYAKDLAEPLPQRYTWSYDLGVTGAGVPLTDSLVLIFRNASGHIVARVAARL